MICNSVWNWAIVMVLGMTSVVEAAPRMDSGVGTSEPILATVLPDHEVPNLFYIFPQTSEMVRNRNGRSEFVYLENRQYRRWGPDRISSAEARVLVQPSIDSDPLRQKIAEIRASNPAARFAVVSAFKTEIRSNESSDRYFLGTECTPISGPLEVPVYCRLSIDPELAPGFRTLLRHSSARVFHYVYHFYGVADGQLHSYTFAVPLKMGALQGPGYFVNQYGDDLN